MQDNRDNFIADACALLERGLNPEDVYSLVDAAVGLFGAVKEEEREEERRDLEGEVLYV